MTVRRMLVFGCAALLLVSCSGGSQPAQTPAQSAQPAAAPAPQSASAPAPPAQTPAQAEQPPAAAASAPSSAASSAAPASKPAEATSASAPASAAAAAPAEPPKPTYQEVTIPAGTTLSVKLVTPVASDTSKVEDRVKGTISKPLVVSGTTVLPAGSELLGTVLDAKRSGRVEGRAVVAFRFDRLVVRKETLRIQTASVTREAAKSTKDDVKKGGLGAGAGAIIGGIAGGGKGAAIGAVVGGTGTVMVTRGQEVRLPVGTIVSVTLQDGVRVLVPTSEQ